MMQSYEVLREAIDGVGVKALAAKLKLSPALIYKWCQPADREQGDASGARNPLDRLADIVRLTKSRRVVNWLCQEADGFFVSNPKPHERSLRLKLLGETQNLVQEFSQLLLTVTRSIEDDGSIDKREADRIRLSWEELKSSAEGFAIACERGLRSSKMPDEAGTGWTQE